MSLRIDTKPRRPGTQCSFDQFIALLGYPEPALAAPPTLLRHIASRPFAAFDNVLTMERPASADIAAHVKRLRAGQRGQPDSQRVVRESEADRPRHLLFAIGLTAVSFFAWIITGIAIAYIAGRF